MELFIEIAGAIITLGGIFKATEMGMTRRRRARRYKALKRLRRRRDRKEMSDEKYKEEALEIERRYKK